MPAEEVPRLLEEDLTFKVEVRLGTYFLNLYNQTEALSDARVRKAMSLVIDRNAICDLVAGGNIPTTELVAPNASKGIGRNNDYDSPSKEDIKNARRLLAEAGYPNGAGMPVLEYITDYGEKHVRIAQGIQEMWKKHLGIEIEIANMEWASFQERKRTQDYDVARGGWIGDYNDPYAFLGVFETGNPSNLTKYHNPEYDDLLSEASSLKGEERYSALEKAEDALLEDGGVIPIFNYVDYIQYADDIEGISRTATGYLYFGDAYFK